MQTDLYPQTHADTRAPRIPRAPTLPRTGRLTAADLDRANAARDAAARTSNARDVTQHITAQDLAARMAHADRVVAAYHGWPRTDHGALVDAAGDTTHLRADIQAVRVLHQNGASHTLATRPPAQPLRLVSAGPRDPAPSHSAARLGTLRRLRDAEARVEIVDLRNRMRQRAALRRIAWRAAIAVAGLGVVAITIAASHRWPWGWALPIVG